MNELPKELLHLIFRNLSIENLYKMKMVNNYCKSIIIEVIFDIHDKFICNGDIWDMLINNYINSIYVIKRRFRSLGKKRLIYKMSNLMSFVIHGNNINIIKYWIENFQLHPDKYLFDAIIRGNLDVIKYLIEKSNHENIDWNLLAEDACTNALNIS